MPTSTSAATVSDTETQSHETQGEEDDRRHGQGPGRFSGRMSTTEFSGLVPGAMNPPERRGPAPVPGVPRAWLRALAIGLTLSPMECRCVLLILGMPKPVSGRRLAKHLGLEYTHTKRAVRSLVAWNIVQRLPDGLVFQPDFKVWRQPAHD
jgi:hypothetical protein